MISKGILFTAMCLLIQSGAMAQTNTTMISTNAKAPVRCSKSIIINAAKEKVWAVLTDVDSWSKWQKDISNSSLKGPLNTGTHFSWKTGGARIKSIIHTVSPFEQFGWTGKTFGATAIHNWTLTEKDGKTLVSVDESMDGLLTKIFRKPFNKNLEKGMLTWLDLLKKQVEN